MEVCWCWSGCDDNGWQSTDRMSRCWRASHHKSRSSHTGLYWPQWAWFV